MGYPVMTGCPQSRCRTGLSILSEHYPLRLDPASTWARTLIPCRKAFVQNFCLRWQPSPGRWPFAAGFLYFPPKKTIFSYKLVSRFYFYLIIHFFTQRDCVQKDFVSKGNGHYIMMEFEANLKIKDKIVLQILTKRSSALPIFSNMALALLNLA